MRTVLALASLATTLAVGGSSAAPFAQCVVFDKPEELYSHSDVVFRGTVIGKRPTGNQGFHVIVDVATFRVDQTWKGQPGPQVEVGADRPFQMDEQYLVFAGGKPLSTSILCRGTELLGQAKAKLDWLSKRLRRPSHPLQPTSGPQVAVK